MVEIVVIIFFITLLLDLEKSLANVNETGGTLDYMESPVSDGTIEENFEEELVNAPQVAEGTTSLNDKETGNLLDDLEADDVSIIHTNLLNNTVYYNSFLFSLVERR